VPTAVQFPRREPLKVLALGAHPDDIEIGCGATVLHLAESAASLDVRWVVLAAHGDRAREAEASAGAFLATAARKEIVLERFRDGFFPYEGGRVKEFVESLKDYEPDLVFTHCRTDLHQDHRLVCELTWNTFRDHLILEYEIPKYDADLGAPNVFVPVAEELCRRKVDCLLTHFPTQRAEKHWFTEDVFFALLRLRGVEANSPTGLAEAFYCRKLVLA
jgi:LmbE family N-acetylglucosaminyl deacetylase